MPLKALIFRCPPYCSPGDEDAFFTWLQSIPCVKKVRGQLRELHVTLASKPTADEMREFVGLFRRYRIDMTVLEHFRTAKNAKWLGGG